MSPPLQIVFVGVTDDGASQMAAALMSDVTADRVDVVAAGLEPGAEVTASCAEAMLELGIEVRRQTLQLLTTDLVRNADRVIVLGRDTRIWSVGGTPIEVWEIPSHTGADGVRLIRDDLQARTEALARQLLLPRPPRPAT